MNQVNVVLGTPRMVFAMTCCLGHSVGASSSSRPGGRSYRKSWRMLYRECHL